jgi:hypothetical protein
MPVEQRPTAPVRRQAPETYFVGRPASSGALRRPGARRAADRHYLAVVALEARRLARQMRTSSPAGRPSAPAGATPARTVATPAEAVR